MSSRTVQPIEPGAVLGMLGSGQLGRMFVLAARRMGYRVHVYSPDADSPAGQVADREFTGAYEDAEALEAFARTVSAVSLEFENIPVSALEAVARHAPVRPDPSVLHTTQHRLREKTALAGAGFPVTPFRPVRTLAELESALAELGCPAVLKTAGFGYDGKGQRRIETPAEAGQALETLAGAEGILEAFIPLEREISVVAARGLGSEDFAHFGVIENEHRRHILHTSVAPGRVPDTLAAQAVRLAREVMETLDVVGVLCVEFFLHRNGDLMINELAPRPHNSGHLTIEGFATSQFEQQVRAVCGLPLGDASLIRPVAMANLLGDLWEGGAPDWTGLCRDFPDVKLHLYGKHDPRPGRKMGHLTVLAETPDRALARAEAAWNHLARANVRA